MRRILLGIGCAVFLLFTSGAASADTIVAANGWNQALPLGYYAPLAPNYTPIVFAISWTQATAYQDVNVAAALFDSTYMPTPPYLGGYVNYSLVNAVGPGTSFSANGITQGTVFIGDQIKDWQLFHLDSLAAGTYYLVLDSSDTASLMINYPPHPATTGTGVTLNGYYVSYAGQRDTAYTPGSSFSYTSEQPEFSITGTPEAAATPEPANLSMAGAGLLFLGSLLYRRSRLSFNR